MYPKTSVMLYALSELGFENEMRWWCVYVMLAILIWWLAGCDSDRLLLSLPHRAGYTLLLLHSLVTTQCSSFPSLTNMSINNTRFSVPATFSLFTISIIILLIKLPKRKGSEVSGSALALSHSLTHSVVENPTGTSDLSLQLQSPNNNNDMYFYPEASPQ